DCGRRQHRFQRRQRPGDEREFEFIEFEFLRRNRRRRNRQSVRRRYGQFAHTTSRSFRQHHYGCGQRQIRLRRGQRFRRQCKFVFARRSRTRRNGQSIHPPPPPQSHSPREPPST